MLFEVNLYKVLCFDVLITVLPQSGLRNPRPGKISWNTPKQASASIHRFPNTIALCLQCTQMCKSRTLKNVIHELVVDLVEIRLFWFHKFLESSNHFQGLLSHYNTLFHITNFSLKIVIFLQICSHEIFFSNPVSRCTWSSESSPRLLNSGIDVKLRILRFHDVKMSVSTVVISSRHRLGKLNFLK